MKRSTATDAKGIPLAAVAAPGNRHDSPLLGPTLARLGRLGPLPEDATTHLGSAYGAVAGATTAAAHGLRAQVAVKGISAPIQNTKRWPVERTSAPRGALSYPRFSREELEGRFLGLMAYLDLKGEGGKSMPANR